MTFRRVGSFAAEGELKRQLDEFARNIESEFNTQASAIAETRLAVEQRETPRGGQLVYPGQSYGFHTEGGDLTITVAKPQAKDEGKFIALVKRSPSNVLFVNAQDGTLINRAAQAAVTTVGVLLLYCDGVEYWT